MAGKALREIPIRFPSSWCKNLGVCLKKAKKKPQCGQTQRDQAVELDYVERGSCAGDKGILEFYISKEDFDLLFSEKRCLM